MWRSGMNFNRIYIKRIFQSGSKIVLWNDSLIEARFVPIRSRSSKNHEKKNEIWIILRFLKFESSFHKNFPNLTHKLGLNGFKITDRGSWGLRRIDDIYCQGQNHSLNPIFMNILWVSKRTKISPFRSNEPRFVLFRSRSGGFRNEFSPWEKQNNRIRSNHWP